MNCSTAAARHLASRYIIYIYLLGLNPSHLDKEMCLIKKCLLVVVLMSTLLLLELWERFMVLFMGVQTRSAVYSPVIDLLCFHVVSDNFFFFVF